MGKAWHAASSKAREVFARADAAMGDALGAKLSTLCFEGPADRLNMTDAAQPALYTCSVASWAGWMEQQGRTISDAAGMIACTAGLSLGEYTALCLAGAFSFEDGLSLVALRGRAMQDAARAGQGGMVALIGASEEQAGEVCEAAREGDVLVCANFNAPGQIVLSGHASACERAVKAAEKLGLRSSVLAVAGAFHSPLMEPAAERLAAALEKTPVGSLRCPVVSNVTGEAYPMGAEAGLIRRRLREQLTSPVRWAQGCGWMVSNVRGGCVELAPGKTLAGLMRRIDRNVKVTGLDEPGA